MKKSTFPLWQVMLVLSATTILFAITRPLVNRSTPNAERFTCISNLKLIGLGIRQYIQDYDEKYPLVGAGKSGWMDSALPYMKSEQIFQCPTEKLGDKSGTTDYFYNARLAGRSEIIRFAASTIMNGDGAGNAPSNASLTGLPKSWKSDSNSPAFRHLGFGVYTFADGHTKWLKAANISGQVPDASNFTFAPW